MTHEDYEDTPELARRTKTSESYWNKLRVAGDGPPYVKVGRLVRYRPSDVETWLASLTRSSTSGADAPQAEIEQIKGRQPSITQPSA
jgi:predicted DNA-binding transcriptional regulator AlpA